MSRKSVLLVFGSPSNASRSTRLLDELGARLTASGVVTRKFSASAFEPHELLNPITETQNIRGLVSAARAASAIVVSTPVYKGTFSGVLKVVLDLIPPDALSGKVGLGIATGRIAQQLGDTAASIGGLFRFFKLDQVVPALTFTDDQVASEQGTPLTEAVEQQLGARLTELLSRLHKDA